MVDHGETLSAAADRSRWGDYHDDLALPLGHWNAPSSRRPRTVIPSTPGPAVALSSRGPLAAGRPCGADSAFGSSQVEFSRVAWGLRRHSHGTREKGCYQVAQRPSRRCRRVLGEIAYEGTLALPSAESWDVQAADGRTIQVKSRLDVPGSKTTQQYSPFRSWDFDVCVFIMFDAFTYDVMQAIEAPSNGIRSLSALVPHVGTTAARVHTRTPLSGLAGAKDVTECMRDAMDNLDLEVPRIGG